MADPENVPRPVVPTSPEPLHSWQVVNPISSGEQHPSRSTEDQLRQHLEVLRQLRQDLQEQPIELIRGSSWRSPPREVDALLERMFAHIASLGYEGVTLFFLDTVRMTLYATKQLLHGELLGGEEEIIIATGSPFRKLLTGEKTSLRFENAPTVVWVPLAAYGEVIGALRVDRSLSRTPIRADEQPLLQDLADEMALAIRSLEFAITSHAQEELLLAFTELSTVLFRSLRLEELLQGVANSLKTHLGFDRVRIYLVDKQEKMLVHQFTLEPTRQQPPMETERYPLTPGVHPMVDLLLRGRGPSLVERPRRTFLYALLTTHEAIEGVLQVDNLLSQQDISVGTMQLVEGIAGLLGMAIQNARVFQGVEELSNTDGLTGLYLLRYFKQRLLEEFYRAERAKGELSVILLDIDHFKTHNDSYGHPAGDRLLVQTAERLLGTARKVDLTARYGGDEFVMLLPETTSDDALFLAARLHQAMQDVPFELPDGRKISMTASLGVATYPIHAKDPEALIKMADEALYWAKMHGRNRICLYAHDLHRKGGT
ncbi:MAG: sensor domain-containing diguanylate cyclase [Elusimicrobia bacterium]|nr:sensor domain-containing diguanylate cyclase [Elusimicrobiota bacterium]